MLIAGRRTNKPELVRAMIDAGRQQFEWTVAGGVRPTAVGVNSGLRIPRAHKFNPVEVISHLRQCAKKLGVKIQTAVRVEELLGNHNSGVLGVRVSKCRRQMLYMGNQMCCLSYWRIRTK